MSVGILIISHDGIGPAILGTATLMLDDCPLQTKLLTTSRDCDPDQLTEDAIEQVEALDTGEGVLVLTDLYGSTPYNIAQKLISQRHVHVVSGLNLSMLIRVLNYPQLTLEELSEKAVSGGKDGISKIVSES
jgi:PTS system ascorbate-specific IIA component